MTGKILETFPAGEPRGCRAAEDYAAQRQREGVPASVVMDMETDSFLVVVPDPQLA
ncbi:hypothetical protein [Streptomyces sp. NPDC060194]|uniref:hypothetical protein n=1 Tax=Streptomyces sp. NPDC060194 TaxID=3347069 RepID=UPI003648B2AA